MEHINKQKNSDFTYIKQAKKVQILQYINQDFQVSVPAYIDELPVFSIGDYSFSEHRGLLKVNLPITVSHIGSHAFYNCRKLQEVLLTDTVLEIEDGAFKNCSMLTQIHMNMFHKKIHAVKAILSELNHEITITLNYNGVNQENQVISQLLFPRYTHDYEENTQARIVNQLTYGSGVHFRECVGSEDIDYKKYDDLFKLAIINDSEETVISIAINRLAYPYKLQKDSRNRYKDYLQKNQMTVAKLLIDLEDLKRLEFISSLKLMTQEELNDMIEYAHNKDKLSCVSYLMDYKNREMKPVSMDFEL